MKMLIQALLHRIASARREHRHLSLEYLVLRHQVEVMKRSAKRPRVSSADRCLWLILSRLWSRWPTSLGNHTNRHGPPIPAETRYLIREMSRDNVRWGEPRIHGELARLGINISRTTLAKYMIRRPYPRSPTWRPFLRNQTPEFFSFEINAELSVSAQVA